MTFDLSGEECGHLQAILSMEIARGESWLRTYAHRDDRDLIERVTERSRQLLVVGK
jgi:hypothetical protein